MTCPLMPPFSPTAYGSLPNSMKLFCPGNPCQPSTPTHGGSIRPVERWVEPLVGGALVPGPFRIEYPVQSALPQYTAPGTRSGVGTEICSAVLARNLPMVEVPQGG